MVIMRGAGAMANQDHQDVVSAEQRALKAIRANDYATISALLDAGQLTDCMSSLLFECCEFDRNQILRKLLRSSQANVNATSEDATTPLMMAAKKNSVDALLCLLSKSGVKVNAVDNYEWTALTYAAYYGHTDCVRLLLDAGAFVNVFDSDHLSCLIWASGRGHAGVVQLLLQFGAKVDASDKYGTTPLIWACRKGHSQVVEVLLAAGANINAAGMFGWSALLIAVRGNYVDTTKLLLEHPLINVNTCDTQRLSPLIIASKDGLYEIARLLLEKDAFVNLSDRYGHTALIHATKSGHVDIVRALVAARADIDHIGFDKKSAIFWAVEKGYLEVASALLEAQPNLEITTSDGETCLIRAVKAKRHDMIRLLLAHNAKVSATDKYGDTVLHAAVRLQSRSLVELLLSNPKNCQLIYKPNKRKETPFSLDQNNPRPIFPSLLDEYEVKQQMGLTNKPFGNSVQPRAAGCGCASGGILADRTNQAPNADGACKCNYEFAGNQGKSDHGELDCHRRRCSSSSRHSSMASTFFGATKDPDSVINSLA